MDIRCKRKHTTKLDLKDFDGELCVISFDNLFKGFVNLRVKKDRDGLFLEIDVDGVEKTE